MTVNELMQLWEVINDPAVMHCYPEVYNDCLVEYVKNGLPHGGAINNRPPTTKDHQGKQQKK